MRAASRLRNQFSLSGCLPDVFGGKMVDSVGDAVGELVGAELTVGANEGEADGVNEGQSDPKSVPDVAPAEHELNPDGTTPAGTSPHNPGTSQT
mmetsp:Transcript_10761/g.20274  ORF Transcript_10761/g.20274 Transcript_10761/m.20274 type:complete len:94 (+) Transcript_10761:388-669(+)